VAGPLSVPLSVLDLCPVPTGTPVGAVLRRSLDLACQVERLGFRRYWVAEHHSVPGIASSSPALLAGQIAAATSTIRVGSGGVMLPNHAPLTVAEQFGMLEALYPDRIDLGLGRAPGTNRATAQVLRRDAATDFPAQLAELQGYFALPKTNGQVRAIPAEGNRPALWLLGATGYSAEQAGLLGLPFAFAYHLSAASAANARPALAVYRQVFRPSAQLPEPYCLISVFALVAAEAEQARWLHGPARLSALRQRAGRPATLPSPEEAAAYPYSAAEQDVMAEATAAHVVGDPARVTSQLSQLLADTGADELMVTTTTFAHADRVASYELLAEATRSARAN
jgi:luciferase family oxidoreductase group 1